MDDGYVGLKRSDRPETIRLVVNVLIAVPSYGRRPRCLIVKWRLYAREVFVVARHIAAQPAERGQERNSHRRCLESQRYREVR